MSAFRSAGGLDDPIAEDGDRGFMGMNQRVQPNLLQAGEVVLSQNGRMEGYWKPRKQVSQKSEPLTTGGEPLELPFLLIDSPKSISAASVLTAGTVTITITGHGFASGSSGWATVAGLSGDVEVNGNQYLTYVDADTLSYPVAGVTTASGTGTLSTTPINDDAASEIRASCVFSDPNSSNDEFVIIALQTVARKIDLQDYSVEDIAYPTGSTVGADSDMVQAFDKVILFRGGQKHLEWYFNGRPILVASQSSTTVTMTVRNHGLAVGDEVVISGVTGTDPPNGTKTVLSVTSEDVFTFTHSPSQSTTFNCDAGIINTDFSFGEAGVYEQPSHIVTTAGGFKITDNLASVFYDDHMDVGDEIEVVSSSTSAQTSGLQIGQRYVVRQIFRQDGSVQISAASSSSVTGGEYNGLYKVTLTASNHNLVVGQPVTISGFSDTKIDGSRIVAEVVDANTFVIYVTQNPSTTITGDEFVTRADGFDFIIDPSTIASHVNDGASLSATPIFTKKVSSGVGFIHQPGAPWGVVFQKRIWTPYYYETGGTYTVPTYTSRGITDELIASDILDSSTFDRIYNQFRASAGTADYLVAAQPFYDDNLIVLNRNSIHNIKGTSGSLADTQVIEMTKEVGCLARKSIVLKGNAIIFLSDDGVYALEFLNDYNLRGTEEPLSKNIQPYIDRINKELASGSVAVYHNNRYYLAVPLDSAPNANDAFGNNAILVFNFLNKAWESIDTFGDANFFINNLVVAGAGVRDDIFVISENGVLHLMESVDAQNDNLSVGVTNPETVSPFIDSVLTTRGYDLGTLERKRFTRGQVQMQCLTGDVGEYSVAFASEDPDQATNLGTTTDMLGGTLLSPTTANEAESANIRFRVGGVRGITGTMTLTRTQGSPKINSITVSGSVTNRQTISQK
jgi:hypothetical protein